MNWWTKFGCKLTGWSSDILSQCSEASRCQLSKYTSALMILILIWSVTGFCFAQRYIELPIWGCCLVSVFFVTIVIMIERQIILTTEKSFSMLAFRGIIALVMAVVGSTIFDQTMFGKDIDKQMANTIEIQVADLTAKRVQNINNKLAALQAEKDSHQKILVADDEASIRRILEARLSMIGYDIVTATDGEEAIAAFNKHNPDLIVLDVMMPKIDGYGVTREIRRTSDVPIIILTALGDVSERITGLELGADDYVIKPFSPKELEARVKAVLRRTNTKEVAAPTSKIAKNIITTGNIRIDTARRQVFRKNERIRLTGMEFSLLELLVNNSGQAYSRNEILQHVWSYPPDHRIDTRVVDVHISRLRSKLETDPANPELILTARGIGYMFQRIS